MASIPRRLCLVGLLLLSCGGSTFGGNYADPSGFSFTYPEGWLPVTRSSLQDANQVLPQELKNWIAKNNVDLNRVAVVLIRNGREEFLESLNVVVDKQQIPVDDNTVKRLTVEMEKQYRSMGAKVDNLQGRVQQVGSHDAVVMEYQIRMPGVPFPLRQRQILLPGGGNTYIVTCSAKADSFDEYRPRFERILASFQVPAPVAKAQVAKGFDWSRIARTGVVGGIVGGLVAGLIGIIKKFTSKPKPERHDDGTAGADRL